MELHQMIQEALRSGKWMLRRSNEGKSVSSDAKGFQWQPVGEWTEAPDWDPAPRCGGGLHGNGPLSKGYWEGGGNIDFCVVDGDMVDIDDAEKVKVRRAMIVLRDTLPGGLSVGGFLDLEGTQITALPDGLSVGGRILR